jgi:hypothetical protein
MGLWLVKYNYLIILSFYQWSEFEPKIIEYNQKVKYLLPYYI